MTRTNHRYSLGLAWMAAVFLLPFPLLSTFMIGLPSIYTSSRFAYALGIYAYTWMLLAIYIGTKPKWLDRWIGLPMAYMIHGVLSLVAILFSFVHKSLSPSDGFIQMTGNVAFFLFLTIALYSMVFMAGWLTSRFSLLAKIKSILEKIFKHEVSVLLHRLNIVATLLVFIHVQLIPYVKANTAFMFTFYLMSFSVFGFYFWTKYRPNAVGYKSTLLSNHSIAPNIHELVIELPRKLQNKLRAGDFVFISFPKVRGMEEPHPFSIVNNPTQSKEIRLAIRGDGDFTRQLQTVSTSEAIYVDGGYGMYQTIIDEQAPEKLIIVTGGIGVTPILSIVESNPKIETTVFHSASTQAALIYEERFREWNNRQNFTSYRQVGRFDKAMVLSQLPKDTSKLLVLISGPTAMGHYWIDEMTKQGIPRHQIFYEEFGW